ncbi:histone deacetylase family protein [Candidatus Vondammii sp. HM_W22]|uniref:histone deacetylase family protein n=1 Tax=Candidatus Vondammii sp. HM_W22 TaxID=2687299 RepID=UPI001F13B102|nr:histone deacetylase family protein [Candidatus Vondammii sp. HM_W22]
MPIAYITHTDCLLHDVGSEHPERPARLNAIQDRLIASRMEFVVMQYDAPMVQRVDLDRVHDPDYVSRIITDAPQEGILMLDSDTFMMPKTLNAVLRAAGAVTHGVDLVMKGEADSAFCTIRPPGHHAERNRAMGFCYFNNVAVGAAYALDVHGLDRVAIIDFDVHHGNGTEAIFEEEPRVLFCSSFQHPFYPFTGHETETAHIVNIPLPAGTDGKIFQQQVTDHWLPALEAFKPQLIMISAGFDAHAEDEMGQLRLRESDYAWVTTELKKIADKYAEGRIVSTLEGGYALDALGRSVIAHLDALLGNS